LIELLFDVHQRSQLRSRIDDTVTLFQVALCRLGVRC